MYPPDAMIKVACISCENPYELDERRLPPSGLRMKCPKCGTAFLVFPDARTAPAPALPPKPIAPPLPKPAIPKPPPPQRGPTIGLDEMDPQDLPTLARPAGAELDLPAPRPARPAAPAAPRGLLGEDLDLPARRPAPREQPESGAAPGRLSPRAPTAALTEDLDLGAPRGAPTDDFDLPAPRRAATPAEDLDLPAPRRAATPAEDLDLPAPRRAAPAEDRDLPAPRRAAPAEDLDLPAPRRAAAPDDELDLPAPARGATGGLDLDLPSPRTKGQSIRPALASPGRTPFDDAEPGLELDLPAPRRAAGEVDLPAPRSAGPGLDLDLPAPRRGASSRALDELDLPAPKHDGADLPGLVGGLELDLPQPRRAGASRGEVDLPAPAGAVLGLGDLDLPQPSRRGEVADLPRPAGVTDLPGIAAGLPGVAAGLPGLSAGLPGLSAGLPGLAAGLPGRARSPQGLGDLDDLELPEPSVSRLRPGTAELELPLPAAPERDHGEVDLGGGAGADEMEFADIPQESSRVGTPRPQVLDKSPTAVASGPKAPSRLPLVLGMGAVVLLGGVGGALSFTPLGPFGYYAIEELLFAGDPAQVSAAIDRADSLLLSDDPGSARDALVQLGTLRHDAGVNRALLARSLVHESLYVIRFGDDMGSGGRSAAIRQRLDERDPGDAMLALALAADELRRGNAAAADGHLATARAYRADDPFVDVLAGELALGRGAWPEARAAFEAALSHGGGAMAQWGVARSLLGQTSSARAAAFEAEDGAELPPEADAAETAAAIAATLTVNPRHVEARIETARAAWGQGQDAVAVPSLMEIVGESEVEGQRLASTSGQRATAYVLLGEIHERRGRLSQALEAYERANQARSADVEALLGAGRMLLAQNRASDALARFESVLGRADAVDTRASTGRSVAQEATLGAARSMMDGDRGQEARTSLETLVAQRPEDSELLLWLGRAEEELEHDDAAELQFRECIRVSPTNFEGYLALARLYGRRSRSSDARAVLDEARARVPETASMRFQLGELEAQRGELTAAISEYRRALELDPRLPSARFGLASTLRRTGQYDAALAAFEELSALDPGYPGLALERGLLFEARGEAEQAVAFYERALGEHPDDPDLLLRLGAAQVAANDIEAAQATLERVQRERPASGEAEHFVGRIDFVRGNYPEALRHFERALQLDETRPEFYLYAGWAALETNNLGQGLSRISQALERDPTLGDGYWLRGTVALRTGAVRDALRDFQRARQLRPGRIEAIAGIGECFDQMRQVPEAISAYEEAVAAAPTRGEWWYRLGRLQLDGSRTADSIRSLDRAATLGDADEHRPPWLPDAHRVLGEAMQLAGDRAGAIEHFRRYLEIAPASALDRASVGRSLAELGITPTE